MKGWKGRGRDLSIDQITDSVDRGEKRRGSSHISFFNILSNISDPSSDMLNCMQISYDTELLVQLKEDNVSAGATVTWLMQQM